MTTQHPLPDGIDITRPNVARIYDYLLGGKDNFAADREAARRLIEAIPDVAAIARDNRSFLGRVVRYLATARYPAVPGPADERPADQANVHDCPRRPPEASGKTSRRP